MNTYSDSKRVKRAALDLRQALQGARAVRTGADLIGNSPFVGAGSGMLLTALMVNINPEFMKLPGWGEAIFTDVGPLNSYAHAVSRDIGALTERVLLSRNNTFFEKATNLCSQWAEAVAKGDPNTEYLDLAAEKTGELILKGLLHDRGAIPKVPADIGERAALAFRQGICSEGLDLEAALKADSDQVRSLAFAEMSAMSATVAMFNAGLIRFENVGSVGVLEGHLRERTYEEFYLGRCLKHIGTYGRMITPLQMIGGCVSLFGSSSSEDRAEVFAIVNSYCKGMSAQMTRSGAEAA